MRRNNLSWVRIKAVLFDIPIIVYFLVKAYLQMDQPEEQEPELSQPPPPEVKEKRPPPHKRHFNLIDGEIRYYLILFCFFN